MLIPLAKELVTDIDATGRVDQLDDDTAVDYLEDVKVQLGV